VQNVVEKPPNLRSKNSWTVINC